nr:reverse transcriptase domain-containing protein [Tanacetum cinerariifolium]
TYNLDQTVRYFANYNQMTANKIDVIESACKKYSQEVLGFSNVTDSGTPTPQNDLIVFATSPTLTPFGDSDFLLFKEADAFLGLEDDPDSPKINPFYYDPEGDILLLEAILNSKPSPPPPNQEQNISSFKEELKAYEAQTVKSSIDEPPEVELKDLPHHLEYAFLEGDNKFPVIIAKELGSEEKAALIKVLKSHKRAIAWKLFDIQGINPKFYTHKILMEEDYKQAVQHQRRVNPKIHDVIKKEVEKILDAGLIYPIYDSPWVRPMHCVPKKGGFTVVENEDNELIPNRLVTGWRGISTTVFLTVFLVISKFPSIQRIRRKPHSPAYMERFLIAACLLGYAMLQARFREKMLKRYEDTNLCLNWEKSHFMVKEGIVLGHKFSKPMTRLLEKDTLVIFSQECADAFQTLKRKLTEAPILIALDWDMPFKIMCDASDFAIEAVLGQQGVYLARKPLISLRLATLDQQEVTIDQITQPERCLIQGFIGLPYIVMPNLVKNCDVRQRQKHKAYWALKHANFDLKTAGDHRNVQIYELNELRDQAYKNSLIYKEKTKTLHDSKIKNRVFNIGDRVLLFNSRLNIFSSKLKSRWSDSFTISQVYPYGTVELSQPDGPNFKVNGHRIKHYFGEDIPKLVVPDLQTFAKDH